MRSRISFERGPGIVGADVDRARDGHRRHDIARDGEPNRSTKATSPDDPFEQFAAWFEEAGKVVDAPEVMTIATATADGRPSARMLLLKDHGPDGFVFFTGYEGRKGRELAENPRAALVFYWRPLGRQVRVEGTVERLATADSEAYFRTRPLQSRHAAWASRQSEVLPIASRSTGASRKPRPASARTSRYPATGAVFACARR